MRKLLSVVAVIVLLAVAPAALAADVPGTWSGLFEAGDKWQIAFTFKQDGTTLTGSVDGADEPITIYDGKIEGDKISFKIVFVGIVIAYEGTVTGDVMKLTSKSSEDYFAGKLTLKRTSPAAPRPAAAASPQ